jgi:hypothetical protein
LQRPPPITKCNFPILLSSGIDIPPIGSSIAGEGRLKGGGWVSTSAVANPLDSADAHPWADWNDRIERDRSCHCLRGW